MQSLSHFDAQGKAVMVEVGHKETTYRYARASGSVLVNAETLQLIKEGRADKGDVLGIARVAGIMAAKKTSELIPLCHPILISSVNITFSLDETNNKVLIEATVNSQGKTGVEMEALTAVSVAALTIYDMCKSKDRGIIITDICLQEKEGGKSGHYKRPVTG
ncbi:MAG: cyclic pyranopterin monophosphate synthase MoaC [Thermodesulfobacteriota bacterium]|nr:cyclic pyranopterin monophosphate synthase MoaC [Desulfovibrionales bacterium]MDQ7837466.1 cyclic pyranopterin monophosphate synthase MoaC [Thermodesulfobacteriota bacterium]